MYNQGVNQPSLHTPPNPFSARRLRPGVIPFLFPDGTTWSDLESRFCDHSFRGQILGPHGTGKSTLLAEWSRRLEQQGWMVVSLRIHNCDQRRFGWDAVRRLGLLMGREGSKNGREDGKQGCLPHGKARTVVMLDGYEQLARWQRSSVQAWLWICGAGLLVTGHEDLGLPTVFETQSTSELAYEVAIQLVSRVGDLEANRESQAPAIPPKVVQRIWAESDGDIRETLFSLFDWWATNVTLIAAPAKSA